MKFHNAVTNYLTLSLALISVLLRLPEVKPGKRIPLRYPLSISDQNLLLIAKYPVRFFEKN
jgi:hypothetical protein